MRIAWITDIHLNFLDKIGRYKFYNKIFMADVDLLAISGDIAEAPSLNSFLMEMKLTIEKPLYFILGNHDYYRGEIASVRNEMTRLSIEEPLLNWLPASGPIALKEDVYLLGQDGWADGRFGNYFQSSIVMNDSQLIIDLFPYACLGKRELLKKMQALASHDAQQLRENLLEAVSMRPRLIIVLLHVPPFKENCLQKGGERNEDFLPYYTSQITGKVLVDTARSYPLINFMVLCGHVHYQSSYQPCANLVVKSGQAEYYYPRIQEIFEL